MKNFIVICGIFLFAWLTLCDSYGFEITLHRHKSARQILLEKGTTEDHLPFLKNAGKPPLLPNDTISLFKFLDSDYYGLIGVGHPAQQFKVVFDTAWGNMYIPSKLCGLTVPACWLLNKYDSKVSGTYKRNGTSFSVEEYGQAIKGFLSIDDVNLGHIKVKNQTFAEVTQLPLLNIFSIVDGVVGMGFDSLALYQVETLFSNIYAQQLIKYPIFAFYLNRDTTTPHGGSLMLGAANPKHFKPETLVTVPVTSETYWQFKATNMSIDNGNNSIPFCSNGCEAVLDTSTRIIMGPVEDIFAINNYLQATALVWNRYEVPCSIIPKLPRFNITIAGHIFSMHGRDMVQQLNVRGVELCLSVFVPSNIPAPRDNLWFLGSAFMQRAYVIFDIGKHTLGFAETK